MPPMDRIVIVGAGALARTALDILDEMGWRAHVHGYLDPGADATLRGQHLDGAPVVGGLDRLSTLKKNGVTHAVIAIEDGRQRATVSQLSIRQGIELVSICHPSATLSRRAKVGDGSILMPGCIITIGATTGLSCVIGSGASIDEDTVIEHYVTIGSGCVVACRSRIGEGTVLGAGVTVAEGVKVGPWTRVPAGARLLEDQLRSGSETGGELRREAVAGSNPGPVATGGRTGQRAGRRSPRRSR
ncbi:MAG: hypothetical protein HYY93_05355 [Planctomycetes bacterium]|nr:hypothetical protein [Planctomycetota bacterium]